MVSVCKVWIFVRNSGAFRPQIIEVSIEANRSVNGV